MPVRSSHSYVDGSRLAQELAQQTGDVILRCGPSLLLGSHTLKEADPDLFALVEKELARQMRSVELASANFTSHFWSAWDQL